MKNTKFEDDISGCVWEATLCLFVVYRRSAYNFIRIKYANSENFNLGLYGFWSIIDGHGPIHALGRPLEIKSWMFQCSRRVGLIVNSRYPNFPEVKRGVNRVLVIVLLLSFSHFQAFPIIYSSFLIVAYKPGIFKPLLYLIFPRKSVLTCSNSKESQDKRPIKRRPAVKKKSEVLTYN